jgi:hypothetical protein
MPDARNHDAHDYAERIRERLPLRNQELGPLNHGVSIVPDMARQIDTSELLIYRSFTGEKPRRSVAMMWNVQPY